MNSVSTYDVTVNLVYGSVYYFILFLLFSLFSESLIDPLIHDKMINI